MHRTYEVGIADGLLIAAGFSLLYWLAYEDGRRSERRRYGGHICIERHVPQPAAPQQDLPTEPIE